VPGFSAFSGRTARPVRPSARSPSLRPVMNPRPTRLPPEPPRRLYRKGERCHPRRRVPHLDNHHRDTLRRYFEHPVKPQHRMHAVTRCSTRSARSPSTAASHHHRRRRAPIFDHRSARCRSGWVVPRPPPPATSADTPPPKPASKGRRDDRSQRLVRHRLGSSRGGCGDDEARIGASSRHFYPGVEGQGADVHS